MDGAQPGAQLGADASDDSEVLGREPYLDSGPTRSAPMLTEMDDEIDILIRGMVDMPHSEAADDGAPPASAAPPDDDEELDRLLVKTGSAIREIGELLEKRANELLPSHWP